MKHVTSKHHLFYLLRTVLERFLAPLLAALSTLCLLGQARADDFYVNASFASPQQEVIKVNVMVGQSRVIRFDQPIDRLSVSNSEVAEAVVVAAKQVVINGKAFGQINFIAWDRSGERALIFDVYVRANLALLDSLVRGLFPKDDIQLSQANGSVILSGKVDDPKKVAQVEAAVQASGFKTVNMLRGPYKSVQQVQLQVRVAEVNRTRAREFGTSHVIQTGPGTGGYINSGGGPYTAGKVEEGNIFGTVSNSLNLFVMGKDAFSFIRVLHSQGALRGLAEPNLIAMDGQQASFLAGGEFPVPIVQGIGDNANVTVLFKEYGVRLNFKPTVVGEDHIRLELEPEVSTIDFANGVKFSGFTIPALRTRRAKTGVELQDGQSFALAGLLDNTETRSLSKIPMLSNVPVLGALFRSEQFQKQETELMFIVTAQIVKPVNPDSLSPMRGVDDLKQGSPLKGTEKGDGLTGNSGFATGREAAPKPPAMATEVPPERPAPAPRAAPVPPSPTAQAIAEPFAPAMPSAAFPAGRTSLARILEWQLANYFLLVPSEILEAAIPVVQVAPTPARQLARYFLLVPPEILEAARGRMIAASGTRRQ